MRHFLLVGRSEGLGNLNRRIVRSHAGICFISASLFQAVNILYEKNVDVLIVSSKSIEEEKLDFIDHIARVFSKMKIYIAMDNGLKSTTRLPENVNILTDVIETDLFSYC